MRYQVYWKAVSAKIHRIFCGASENKTPNVVSRGESQKSFFQQEDEVSKELAEYVGGAFGPLRVNISCQQRNLILQGIYCRYGNPMIAFKKFHHRRCTMKVSQGINYWLEYHKLHSKKKHPQNLPVSPFKIDYPIR